MPEEQVLNKKGETESQNIDRVLIVLHGSPKKSANNWDGFRRYLAQSLNLKDNQVLICFLQFGEPSVETVLREVLTDGAKRVIIHPLFLSAGVHVTKDLPSLVKRLRQEYRNVEILITKPLGAHELLADIVKERIAEVTPYTGRTIEEESFRIIESEFDLSRYKVKEREIVKRVIHATADPEYLETMIFHPRAIELSLENLRLGKRILVDVEMVRAGISKRLYPQDKVLCYLNTVAEVEQGTRAERAIELALRENEDIGIVAIGNSPTALLRAMAVIEELSRRDLVIIGMPVGFVRAISSKLSLISQDIPYITNVSRKGGSPAVCAVINALLRML